MAKSSLFNQFSLPLRSTPFFSNISHQFLLFPISSNFQNPLSKIHWFGEFGIEFGWNGKRDPHPFPNGYLWDWLREAYKRGIASSPKRQFPNWADQAKKHPPVESVRDEMKEGIGIGISNEYLEEGGGDGWEAYYTGREDGTNSQFLGLSSREKNSTCCAGVRDRSQIEHNFPPLMIARCPKKQFIYKLGPKHKNTTDGELVEWMEWKEASASTSVTNFSTF